MSSEQIKAIFNMDNIITYMLFIDRKYNKIPTY